MRTQEAKVEREIERSSAAAQTNPDAGDDRLLGGVFIFLAVALVALPWVAPGGFTGVDTGFVLAKIFAAVLVLVGVHKIVNAGKE